MKRFTFSFLIYLLISSLVVPSLATVNAQEVQDNPMIYFVMVDRFSNGDPGNDRGGESGDRSVTGFDPDDPGFFHGGDLVGLKSRLDYIASLGFNAIWITPVVRQVPLSPTAESAAYHGYWGAGFDEVDPRFGTMAQMKDLVEAAHQRGIKIYLDVVVNHTGDLISYMEGENYLSLKDHPYKRADGTTFNPVKLANSPRFPQLPSLDTAVSFPKSLRINPTIRKSPEWLNDPRNYHNRGNFSASGESSTYGDFYGLDDLFTESPVVADGWVDVLSDWISEVGVDGFRLDTYKHVNAEFWREVLPRIREVAQRSGKSYFPMWGEIYDYDPGRITEWVKKTGLAEALDFPIQGAIAGYVIDEDAPAFSRAFDDDDLYITADSDASANGTFLGNHDMGRLGGFIYSRHRNPDVALSKLQIAHALLYAIRGVPIVYYGDEFGMIGGRDKAARQSLFPTEVIEWQREPRIGMEPIGTRSYFDVDHPMQQTLRELAELRREFPGLRDGYQSLKSSKGGIVALTRFDRERETELLFLFNPTSKESSITLQDGVGLTRIRGNARITGEKGHVPALSWSLFTRVRAKESSGLGVGAKVTLLTPGKYRYDPSLYFFRARVEGMTFPAVRFEYRVQSGEWQDLGVDSSPIFGSPIYRIAPRRASLPQEERLRLRAVAIDLDGSEVRSKAILLRLPK